VHEGHEEKMKILVWSNLSVNLLQLNIFVTFVFFLVKKVFWINFTQVSVYKYVAILSR